MTKPLSPPHTNGRPHTNRRRRGLALEVLPATFAVCRLEPSSAVPAWATDGAFSSVSRSPYELSILCEDRAVPEGVRSERDFRAIKVLGPVDDEGPLDFALIGVLASLAVPLAEARISLFTVSTFDTDYLFVRQKKVEEAVRVLGELGHEIRRPDRARPELAEEEPPDAGGPPEPTPEEPGAARRPRRARRAREEPTGAPEEPAESPVAAERARQDEAAAEAPRETVSRSASTKEDVGSRQPEPQVMERADPAAGRKAEGSRAPEEEAGVAAREPDAGEPPGCPAPAQQAADPGAGDLFSGAIPQHPVETTDQSFLALGLSAPILETVREVGFEHPTPIQAAVIPAALAGKDVIGLAETGSGKTAAFVLPLAEKLTRGRGIRGLILSPTREIALQTKAFLDVFGRDHHLATACLIGGVRYGPQLEALRRHPDILVATPGRLIDHAGRRNVSLDRIEELVIDEADHMLDLGFLPQIREILDRLPDERRTMMFSATMPPAIARLAQHHLRDPVTLDFRPEGHAAAGLDHRLFLVREEDRKACLVALLDDVEGSTLIFVRRKIEAEWLANQLEKAGHEVARIHSDRSQGQRVEALQEFKRGGHQVLVATDVAARGIDIPRIRHVVNFGMPETVEDYIHRAGRTARGQAGGIVSTIATWLDKLTIRDIEERLGQGLPRCQVAGVEPYVELQPRKTLRRRLL